MTVAEAAKRVVIPIVPAADSSAQMISLYVSEANVFTKPSHLLDLIGLHAQASEAVPFTHAGAGADIANLLGTSAAEIERLMHSPVEDQLGRSCIHWFGESIERRHIEAKARPCRAVNRSRNTATVGIAAGPGDVIARTRPRGDG